MGNDRLRSKQVGSQASRRVTRRLAWIQPVCISINAVPALKGLEDMLITFANNLNPDEVPQNVGPHLRFKLFNIKLRLYISKLPA